MRRFMSASTMASAMAVLLSTGGALGDDQVSEQQISGQQQQYQHQQKDKPHAMSRAEYRPDLHRISTFKGMKVVTESGEEFGTVEDLAVDIDHGRLAYAVISHGGFLGIGDKDVLLPFSTIKAGSAEERRLMTKATKEQFKQSEGFDEENQDEVRKLSDPAFAQRFHTQFNVRPYWEKKGHARMSHEKEADRERGADERSQAQEDRLRAQQDREEARQRQGEQPGQVGQTGQDRPGERFGEKARMRGPGEIVLSSTLLSAGGADVKTKDGIDAGDLKDLMVDLHGGHIAYAIVDREDAIVPENQLCAVPWDEFRLQRAEPRPNLIVELPVQKIKDAPGFQDSQWPDMAKMEWSERIHEYYGATPYYEVYGYVSTPEGEYGDREFARGETHTCTGTIQSIDRTGAQALGAQTGQRPMTLQLKSKAEGQVGEQKQPSTATVILAPSSFLESRGVNLQQGQEITVNGWRSERAGDNRIVAMSVESGGKSVELRDRNGRPLWTSRPGAGHQQHQETGEQQPGTPR